MSEVIIFIEEHWMCSDCVMLCSGSAPSCVKAPSTTPFMIYQDTDEQENGGWVEAFVHSVMWLSQSVMERALWLCALRLSFSSDQARSKPAVIRALTEIPVSKANVSTVSSVESKAVFPSTYFYVNFGTWHKKTLNGNTKMHLNSKKCTKLCALLRWIHFYPKKTCAKTETHLL